MRKLPISGLQWATMVIAFFVLAAIEANDINPGYSFSSGEQNVTHTKLNSLVDGATINTTFFTDKSAAQPVSGDTILFYQAISGAFKKASYSTFYLGNTNVITGQTEDTAPGTNDFMLTYDTSAGLLKKVALYNMYPLSGLNELTTPPDIGYRFHIQDTTGVNYWSSMTNAFNQVYRFWKLANPSNAVSDATNFYLPNRGTPIKTDAFILWTGQTNNYSTLSNLVTQATAATIATNGDFIPGFSTNDNQWVKWTIKQIASFATNTLNSPTLAQTNKLPQTFITNTIALGSGLLVNGAHGLGGTPQCVRWVLVQTNSVADLGWGQNREVDIASFFDSSTGKAAFATSADITAILLVCETATIQTRSAVDGSVGSINTGKWVAKGYFTYFPTFP